MPTRTPNKSSSKDCFGRPSSVNSVTVAPGENSVDYMLAQKEHANVHKPMQEVFSTPTTRNGRTRRPSQFKDNLGSVNKEEISQAKFLREPAKLNNLGRPTNDLEMMATQREHLKLERDAEMQEQEADDSDSNEQNCSDRLKCFCQLFSENEIVLPEKHEATMQLHTYKVVRLWTVGMFIGTLSSSFTSSDLTMEKTPIQFILGYVLVISCTLSLIFSFACDSRIMAIIAAVLYQLRLILNLTVPVDFDDEQARFKNMFNMIHVLFGAFFHVTMLAKIIQVSKSLWYLLNLIILTFFMVYKLLGPDNLKSHARQAVLFILPVIVFWTIFSVVTNSISNFNFEMLLTSVKESQELSMQQRLIGIYREIFQVLDGPIMTIGSNENIQVANAAFIKFFKMNFGLDLEGPAANQYFINLFQQQQKGLFRQTKQESEQLINLKMFKVFRNYYHEDAGGLHESLGYSLAELKEQEFSLKNLIDLGPSFTDGKIFQSCFSDTLQRRQGENADAYVYFSFKITILKVENEDNLTNDENSKIVIEVKDVSGKLLYGEAQAQKQYITMMQASVSHEMRQPLSSLIYQLYHVQKLLKQAVKLNRTMRKQFKEIVLQLPNLKKIFSDIIAKAERQTEDLKFSCRKILSSTQFIDFFVHDMLDLCVLTEKRENFASNIEEFDIRDAMKVVQEMFQERIQNKLLNFVLKFVNFQGSNLRSDANQLDEIKFEGSDWNVSDEEEKEAGRDNEAHYVVSTDLKRLLQVVINLVSNATKFTNKNGSVKVTTTLIESEKKLQVSIEDTGVGIKDSDKRQLFKLFGCVEDQKEKINTKGIGLGLVISRLIVQSFDGHIDFSSTFGRGSTFTFTFKLFLPQDLACDEAIANAGKYLEQLPKFDDETLGLKEQQIGIDDDSEESDEIKKENAHVGAQSFPEIMAKIENWQRSGKRRILLADDEPMCLMGLKGLLEVSKINMDLIDTVEDGAQAVKIVEEALRMGLNYHIIFTDINMPNMDGIEATKVIKELYENHPHVQRPTIVGITGHYDPAFIQKARDAGMDQVEAKPMYLPQLRQILTHHDLLGHKEVIRHETT